MGQGRWTAATGTLMCALASVCAYGYGVAALWQLDVPSAVRVAVIVAVLLIGIAVFAIGGQAMTTATRWLTERATTSTWPDSRGPGDESAKDAGVELSQRHGGNVTDPGAAQHRDHRRD